ncbi:MULTISPECIES: GntR family transcriptional regulator [unclassified Caballeronia]|uniref:GntR family transcriptional regulator n=1 Tax=unclassified Caballeronia TaxID=2646786 RepID=UPI00158B4618|nr:MULTISPECIES: GntR family transcriptional regulator [unclassified Caballeronia]QSN63506.1 GntR family transcriptional regulator [Caballeronia sp. M1242]
MTSEPCHEQTWWQLPAAALRQIKDTLRERILDGTYAPHSHMPSEHELCAMLGVSRITVWQALGDLQKEGLLFRLRGNGTFVSKPKAFQNVPLGHADVSIEATLADEDIAGALRVEDGSPVLRIERLPHDASGNPVDFEFLYFRGDAFQYRQRVDSQKTRARGRNNQ